jgi:hypothetical protein
VEYLLFSLKYNSLLNTKDTGKTIPKGTSIFACENG